MNILAISDQAIQAFSGDFSGEQLVAFTFFIGSMAMMAATAFFWLEMRNIDAKWRTSLLVSGLITFIAAVHYYYMRDYYITATFMGVDAEGNAIMGTNGSPTFLRYVDWILTVPLMCVEFYLITKKAGGQINTMWKLIFASVVMLVTGYIGEAIFQDDAWLWGLISGIAYFYIVYLVFFGEIAELAGNAGGAVQKANKVLGWFVLVGWAIYPIGYMAGTTGWYGEAGQFFGMDLSLDVVYNIADAINKIGFGLVIYALAVADGKGE